jgi:hypothetical protein
MVSLSSNYVGIVQTMRGNGIICYTRLLNCPVNRTQKQDRLEPNRFPALASQKKNGCCTRAKVTDVSRIYGIFTNALLTRSKYSQHPILKDPQPTFLPQYQRPSFTLINRYKLLSQV